MKTKIAAAVSVAWRYLCVGTKMFLAVFGISIVFFQTKIALDHNQRFAAVFLGLLGVGFTAELLREIVDAIERAKWKKVETQTENERKLP